VILLLDNYDSFTYNLFDYLKQLHDEVVVYRNDAISIDEIKQLQPNAIVISPGPKTPEEAGITMQVIQHFHTTIPILGICLGHQAIGIFFGAKLAKLSYPMHGKTSKISYNDDAIFENIENPFEAMRYHSLYLKNLENTPLKIIANTNDNTVMAIKHQLLPIYGLQFHPESILTEEGLKILENWVNILHNIKL
jgi:anthranilate synthase/aminodeoxychorismate synthase-like glutamine amidotransferase